MSVKKCPKCGAVWYTPLPKCAFCGIEGEEQPMSTHTGRLPEKPQPAPKAEPEKPIAQVAVAEATPVPPTSADAPASSVEAEANPPPAPASITPAAIAPATPLLGETSPVGLDPRTDPHRPSVPETPRAPLEPLPPAVVEKRKEAATFPPAPQVPSSKVPFVLGLLGLAACLVLPVAVLYETRRVVSILADLGAGILLPFAPLAWLVGRRYEERCFDLGYRPARLGRIGRLLGVVVTILVALEGSALSILSAIQRISMGK